MYQRAPPNSRRICFKHVCCDRPGRNPCEQSKNCGSYRWSNIRISTFWTNSLLRTAELLLFVVSFYVRRSARLVHNRVMKSESKAAYALTVPGHTPLNSNPLVRSKDACLRGRKHYRFGPAQVVFKHNKATGISTYVSPFRTKYRHAGEHYVGVTLHLVKRLALSVLRWPRSFAPQSKRSRPKVLNALPVRRSELTLRLLSYRRSALLSGSGLIRSLAVLAHCGP
jgi:hypothetical protein